MHYEADVDVICNSVEVLLRRCTKQAAAKGVQGGRRQASRAKWKPIGRILEGVYS